VTGVREAAEQETLPAAGPARGPRQVHRLAVAAVAGVLAVVVVGLATGLLAGDPVGAGDNGDGVRLFCGVGLVPDTPTSQASWAGGVVLEFLAGGEPCPDPAPSSARTLLSAAVGDTVGPWSLVELGRLYVVAVALVTALGAWAATAGGLVRGLVVVPALAPLAGPDFSRFFVSTYGEPAGLLGTYALCIGAAVLAVTRPEHRGARGLALVLVAGGGFLAATSKTAYVPVMAVAVLLCAVTAVGAARRRRWRAHLAGPALALLLVLAFLAPLAAAQEWQARHYSWVNTHNVVYTLLLPEVGPEAAEAVGLPAEAERFSGRSYYPDGPAGVPGAEVIAADPDGVRNAAWKELARHPGALLDALGIALQSTAGRDLDYLVDQPWTPETTTSPVANPVGEQAATAEALHGWLDDMSLPWLPSVVAALALAFGAASLRIRPPLARGLARIAGVAGVTALGLALVAVLGDGYFEIAKHMWLAAYLLDLASWAMAGTVVAGGVVLARRRYSAA
jgi:hypothetical protein